MNNNLAAVAKRMIERAGNGAPLVQMTKCRLTTIQELVGHRFPASTQVYLHAFNPNKKSVIDRRTIPK